MALGTERGNGALWKSEMDQAHGARLQISIGIQGATYPVRAPQDRRAEPGAAAAAAGAAAVETGTRDSFLQRRKTS